MPINTYLIRNLPEFFEKVITFSKGDGDIWFRGHKKYYYNLEPSSYRQNNFRKNSRLVERRSIAKSRSGMFHITGTKYLDNDLNWLCYLQHIGLNTRLLDWTIDVSTAFYFAFEDFIVKDSISAKEMPSIWVLKLNSFMKELNNYIATTKKPFGTRHTKYLLDFFDCIHPKSAQEVIEAEDYGKKRGVLENVYIPFLSPFVNERSKSQGGCFIRFPLLDGSPSDKFEEMWLDNFCNHSSHFHSLAHFIFTHPKQISEDLTIFNLETSRIYPEEMNIAGRINQRV